MFATTKMWVFSVYYIVCIGIYILTYCKIDRSLIALKLQVFMDTRIHNQICSGKTLKYTLSLRPLNLAICKYSDLARINLSNFQTHT